MKLKEFLDNLNKLAVEQPEVLELDVISSECGGANWYEPVTAAAELGCIDSNGDFDKSGDVNAICIN